MGISGCAINIGKNLTRREPAAAAGIPHASILRPRTRISIIFAATVTSLIAVSALGTYLFVGRLADDDVVNLTDDYATEVDWNTSGHGEMLLSEAKRAAVMSTVATMGSLFFVVLGFVFVADRRVSQTHRSQLAERESARSQVQEASEAAIQATKAKSEFLATMSHEIRTPMNAIVGMADLLSETKLDPDQQRYASVISRSADTLLALINDILDLSKVEAGQISLETVDFHLGDLVEDSVEVLSLRAKTKGLDLACHIGRNVPMALVGDPLRLNQVLTNLVGNAIKFTEDGGVVVRVEKDPESAEPGSLLFQVFDTGIGIPRDKQEYIFDRFTQADSSITRQYGGTGLGLAISRRLVEMMGGRIWVESEVGQGSTFYFTARFAVQADPKIWVGPPGEELVGVKTLIVDARALNRRILLNMLADWGAVATEARDAREAVSELERARMEGAPYRLLLLDGDLPGPGSFHEIEGILANPASRDIVVMMFSPQDLTEKITHYRELGVSRFITRPVTQTGLWSAITANPDMKNGGPPAGVPEAVAYGRESQRALRILLAEDNEDNRLLLQAYLKGTPHHLDIAENGETAVSKFTAASYDLVLMDVQMPVMDGYTATGRIREWEIARGADPTPVLALTAHALKDDQRKSLEAGCTGHISKPIKKKVLMEYILEYTTPTKKEVPV